MQPVNPVTVTPVTATPVTETTSFPTTAPTTIEGNTTSQPVITGYYPNTTPNTPTSNTSVNTAQPSAIAGLTTSPTGARRINQLENIPLPASFTGAKTIDLESFNQPLVAPVSNASYGTRYCCVQSRKPVCKYGV